MTKFNSPRNRSGVWTNSRVQTTSSTFSEESPKPLKNTVEDGYTRLTRAWPLDNSSCVNQFTPASEGLQDGGYLRRIGWDQPRTRARSVG